MDNQNKTRPYWEGRQDKRSERMDNQDKAKANWVARQEIVEDGAVIGYVDTSDKGALKFTSVNQSGQERFLFCLMPSHLHYISAFDVKAYSQGEEYGTIMHQALLNKERAKVEGQKTKEIQKQALTAQAALEALKRLGVDVSKLAG